MNVLQIIPSLNSGGAEQATVDITAGLRAAGHQATVISSGGTKERDISESGGAHIARPVDSKNPAVMLANAVWLRNFIRANKIDIVHARSRAPAWSAFLATRGLPCSFVTTFHAAYKFSDPFKKFYNSIMARSDRIIAISEFISTHIHDTYGVPRKKICTIPRGVDLNAFDPARVTETRREYLRRTWMVDKSQTIILLPGRLSPIKGQKTLIDAMSILPASLGDVVAVIMGDDQGRDQYRLSLNQMIRDRGLEERVKIATPTIDMPAAYSLAAVAVAPSLVPEGFGRVPVEAMSMGVPVIASDLGGYHETVKPGETGWLVPPGDPEKLAEAILQVLHQSPEARAAMAERAMQQTRARYDRRKMVADTLKVYGEVARG